MREPVQYRRLMELSDFDRFDLARFRQKLCTSASFPAELKADVLRRWPGGLSGYCGNTVLLSDFDPYSTHVQPKELPWPERRRRWGRVRGCRIT